MDFGGPQFILAIVAMAMFAGILKTAIRARHGAYDRRGRGRYQRPMRPRSPRSPICAARMREKIVTDSGYDLAHQIEALRDREPGVKLGGER